MLSASGERRMFLWDTTSRWTDLDVSWSGGDATRASTSSAFKQTLTVQLHRSSLPNGGELYELLRQRAKKRRKRYATNESRGRLPGKRHISERPAEVETRQSVGHWEIDTVVGVGSKDCVVTLVERKTGYAKVGKLRDRSAEEMVRCTRMLMSRSPRPFRTITSDNGTEFHNYADVERATGTKYYFATPYHSWERGTSENFNGLVRQYLPKRTSFAHVDQNFCNYLADRLNRRPRKRLGYRTPEECFYDK